MLLWYDGALRDPATPLITALDHGLTVGDGVWNASGPDAPTGVRLIVGMRLRG